ncbi:MAG TPA: type II toxin-antitoxin system RelE/ParE family toxin [Lactobacillaceae bacterium]|jgi:plasmid stabilization system protein ParE
MQVIVTPKAKSDIQSNVLYIAKELGSPATAENLYFDLLDGIDALADIANTKAPYIVDGETSYYRFDVKQCALIYELIAGTVYVDRVLHRLQNIPDHLNE